MYRIDNATGTPAQTIQATNEFEWKVRSQPLPQVFLLAIAAARNRVAIVYAGKATPGYWALLSCAN